MKKTLIALLALSSMAMAETVIYDLSTNSQSYGEYKDITFLTSGNVTDSTASVSTTFNGATVSFKATTGSGSSRGMLGTAAKWTGGLPVDLGLSSDDVGTLTSTAAYITGQNNATYPGIITLTISGLAQGTYSLSALSAKGTGDTSPITMNLSVNGTQWTGDATYYSYTDGKWGDAATGTPSFEAVPNNTPSGAFASFSDIEVTVPNSVLQLQLVGVPAFGNKENLKALQFVSLSNNPSVPEPTTGSLSLLALAGLCARRRKK